ncbi:MAG: hypothetical protein LBE20_05875, partial [Deltaproteobacteria bacterium]|nr:hypothetical protein [Deltaproteobacteria bacterium]
TACSTGTYSTDGNSASACTNCTSTTVASCSATTGGAQTCTAGNKLNGTAGASGSTCSTCSTGTYRSGVGTTCSSCSNYPSPVTTCDPGSGAATGCVAGYMLSGGACVAAPIASATGKSCSDNGVTNWGTMQSFGTTQCGEMTNYDGTEKMFAGTTGGSLGGVNTVCVKDSRNSQAYRVRRMPDGKCWMIDNLKYAEGSYKDPASSSASDGGVYCTTNNNGSSPFDEGKWPKSTTGCGYLYAWATATGGTSGGSVICPNGWTLPADGMYGTLSSAIGGNGLSYGGGLAFQAPYSGFYYSSSFGNQSVYGYYWSSTEYDTDYARLLSFNYTGPLNTSNSSNKSIYLAVRCYR